MGDYTIEKPKFQRTAVCLADFGPFLASADDSRCLNQFCWKQLDAVLEASMVNRRVDTVFIGCHRGTDRYKNNGKTRKVYRFRKDRDIHNASTEFSIYAYTFCWPVRNQRLEDKEGRFHPRTPAMAARLADHVWSIKELAPPPSMTR